MPLFDQRGCGRSRPSALLTNTTTWHLVADMEQLCTLMGCRAVAGVGWLLGQHAGAGLCRTHPQRVSALVVRGIFTLRQSELLWFYQEGASALFPDLWEGFVAPIPVEERGD